MSEKVLVFYVIKFTVDLSFGRVKAIALAHSDYMTSTKDRVIGVYNCEYDAYLAANKKANGKVFRTIRRKQ